VVDVQSAREASDSVSLGQRVIDFRTERGLLREDLANKLGVRPVTVLRWETGTSKPSPSVARKLQDLGFGPLSSHDTKVHSTPRSTLIEPDRLRSQIRDALSYAGKPKKFEPAPYVLNGPADQLGFFEELYQLQDSDSGSIPEAAWKRRLSCVSTVDGEATAMAELENKRPDAKSWDGNYGPHGWHRYVGRFPAHLVRALLNHFEATPGETVCDPFVGSGTTLVEARLLGLSAVGIDLCPLSCMLSRTKAQFPADPQSLLSAFTRLTERYQLRLAEFKGSFSPDTFRHEQVLQRSSNPIPRFANIEKWFTAQALLGTSIAVQVIMDEKDYARDFFATALSAEMRSIGNVDVDVVRAEYRKAPRMAVDVLRLLSRRVRKMLANIEQTVMTHRELLSSSEHISVLQENMLSSSIGQGSIDYIITSPPYGVESLSYLRTHLLSYRSLDAYLHYDPYEMSDEMVGSEYLALDPASAGREAAQRSPCFKSFFSSGFEGTDSRRVAMMERFFDDLVQAGDNFRLWLRPAGRVAFVIGNKRLGERVIPTDTIVSEVFAASGLRLDKVVRHKLKTNNSNSEVPWQERVIQEEAVLIFRRL
jgi:transcriptional regulator with XRE-family HTH domain